MERKRGMWKQGWGCAQLSRGILLQGEQRNRSVTEGVVFNKFVFALEFLIAFLFTLLYLPLGPP